MFRACEPMRMMHMFVRCHVYLEYHLNIFQIFRPGDAPAGINAGTGPVITQPEAHRRYGPGQPTMASVASARCVSDGAPKRQRAQPSR